MLNALHISGITVAPFAGAWIEIADGGAVSKSAEVAPFAGAWIEINNLATLFPG